MMFKTHIVAGALTGIGIASILPDSGMVADEIVMSSMTIGGALLGSMFPDIDKPSSKLGRKVKPLSYVIEFIFGHRGFTHSLPFLVLFSSLCWFYIENGISPELFYYVKYAFLGFVGGFISHLLLDWVTKQPVPIFYPISRKGYALYLFKTNGVGEFIFRWIMILGSLYLGYLYYTV